MTTEKQDVYTRITNTIIASLEHGVRPWVQPWKTGNCDARVMRPLRRNGQPQPTANRVERVARAEQFFANTDLTTRYGGDRAYYSESADLIQMPPIEAFKDALSFYSTLGHEAVHATKSNHRLARDFGRKT